MAAKLFISYSHKDESFKDDLQTGLAPLKRQGHILSWDDRAITAGEEWDHKIKSSLKDADIIILLISPPFLASRYVNEIEIETAMNRHQDPNDTARVVPVIIRPCDWKGYAFASLQALPKNSKPISTWNNYDEAMLDVVNGIKRLVVQKDQRRSTPVVDNSTPRTSENQSLDQANNGLSLVALKQEIAAGKSDQVIQNLLTKSDLDADIQNQLIMLSSRINALKKNKLMGIIADNEANRTQNQINYALLQVLNDLG